MIYKCDICHKCFDHKSHYERHLNRKYKCKSTNIIINHLDNLSIKNVTNSTTTSNSL